MATREVQLLAVEQEQDGQRLDNFLIRRLRGVPKSRIYRLIRRGEVRVNSRRCKPEQKLACGDKVRVPPYSGPDDPQPPKPSPELAQRLTDAVLHEAEDYLAINKPSGLPVHGGSGIHLGLIEALRQIRPEWQQSELVHRLDQSTSGLLLIAKNAAALKVLQDQFKARRVEKTYLALVQGHWDSALKKISVPLIKGEAYGGERFVRAAPDSDAGNSRHSKKSSNSGDSKDNKGSNDSKPKAALTRFQVVRHYSNGTLLQAYPETGRTHQIRVHCQYAGHPIVGERKYTAGWQGGSDAIQEINFLCLHAAGLEFCPPGSSKPLRLQAELPAGFAALLETLESPAA